MSLVRAILQAIDNGRTAKTEVEFYEAAASQLAFLNREERIAWLKNFKQEILESCMSKSLT